MDPENAILVSLLIHVPAVVTWIAFAAVEAAVVRWRFRPAEVRHFTTVTNAQGT